MFEFIKREKKVYTAFTNGLQTYVSSAYFLPLCFQSVGGASPLRSGLLILPVALVQSLVGVGAGFLIRRTGRYLELIWAGMLVLTLGFGLFIDFDAHFSLSKVVLF